jgi:hypothetical protein
MQNSSLFQDFNVSAIIILIQNHGNHLVLVAVLENSVNCDDLHSFASFTISEEMTILGSKSSNFPSSLRGISQGAEAFQFSW